MMRVSHVLAHLTLGQKNPTLNVMGNGSFNLLAVESPFPAVLAPDRRSR